MQAMLCLSDDAQDPRRRITKMPRPFEVNKQLSRCLYNRPNSKAGTYTDPCYVVRVVVRDDSVLIVDHDLAWFNSLVGNYSLFQTSHEMHKLAVACS